MARITYSPGVTKLAGSIGGVIYQRNAFGNTVKLRSNSTINPTALQVVYQQRLSYLVALWPTLTQIKKDTWNVFAAAHDHTTPWGKAKTLSGYQWFLSCNLRRMLSYSTAISTAPSWSIKTPPDSFIIETSATYIRAAWTAPYSPPGNLIAYVSLPLRQSSLKLRRSLYYIKNYSFDAYFLPSQDELEAMYDNLHAEGVGGFASAQYWSSSELNVITSHYHNFQYNTQAATTKDTEYHVRACRSFTAVAGAYSLRDTGPAGGLIFYVDGGTTYYEAAPSDQSIGKVWSNIINTEITGTGTAIGTGQANTTAIIDQAGHVTSAAQLCNDLNLHDYNSLNITAEVAALYNVTWSTFYASAKCSIIVRLLQGSFATGLFSAYTSAIVKINL